MLSLCGWEDYVLAARLGWHTILVCQWTRGTLEYRVAALTEA